MQPKKSSLSTLSNEALCRLRDEVVALLNNRAENLRRELEQLTGCAVAHGGQTDSAVNASKAKREKMAQNTVGRMAIHGAGEGHGPDG